MRLGISHVLPHETPEEWAKTQRELGLGAVVFPVDYTAKDSVIADYAAACKKYDLHIAEVGAWSNPVAEDSAAREAALQKCKGQLRLAEELHAACCVNIAGAYAGARWDGFCRENYSKEAYDATIASIRDIIDSVHPQHTAYCMEAMQWMIPDSPQQYTQMLRDVQREAFAVHIDVVNWIYTPQHYLFNHEFIDEIFDELGQGVKSCHVKDTLLEPGMTSLLRETPAGLGTLDLAHYARRAHALDPDMPMIIEHLSTDQDYLDAIARVKHILNQNAIPMA